MSLNYSGYQVRLIANPGHPHQKVDIGGFSEPTGDVLEDKKKAFMKAMEEFTNHPKFDELTNGLMDEFSVDVETLVHTSMPR